MLTEQDKKLIHVAMEKAGGKAPDAAVLLGVSTRELLTKLHNNKDLKARWTNSAKAKDGSMVQSEPQVPSASTVTIHRPAPATIASEEELAKAIEKEDALVRKGMEAIGVRGKALDLAMALQKFHNRHFQRAIEMIGGGISKQFLDLMAEVEAISAKLNAKTSSDPLSLPEELMLREDRSRLLDQMNKMYDRANQAVLTQAKVKAMQNGGGKNGGKPKPRFSPLVAVHAEGNVTLSQPK